MENNSKRSGMTNLSRQFFNKNFLRDDGIKANKYSRNK